MLIGSTSPTYINDHSNDINTIMEDNTGKLWFGTRGEACFYDGKTFTVLKNKDGKAFKT